MTVMDTETSHRDRVTTRMNALRENARTHMEPVLKNVTGSMARHPFATVAVGLGVGYVISRLRR